MADVEESLGIEERAGSLLHLRATGELLGRCEFIHGGERRGGGGMVLKTVCHRHKPPVGCKARCQLLVDAGSEVFERYRQSLQWLVDGSDSPMHHWECREAVRREVGQPVAVPPPKWMRDTAD